MLSFYSEGKREVSCRLLTLCKVVMTPCAVQTQKNTTVSVFSCMHHSLLPTPTQEGKLSYKGTVGKKTLNDVATQGKFL